MQRMSNVHHPPLVSLPQPQLRELRIGEFEPTRWWATIREDIVVRQRYRCTDYRADVSKRFGRVQSRDRTHDRGSFCHPAGWALMLDHSRLQQLAGKEGRSQQTIVLNRIP
jgi:hypothetical protein